jgi:hypothetical protein
MQTLTRGPALRQPPPAHPAAPQARRLAAAHGVNVATAACDVTDVAAQAAAFESHMARHGRLDAAVINAGVFSTEPFLDGGPEDRKWEETIAVDLVAAITGTRLAARHMQLPAAGGGDGGGSGSAGGGDGGGRGGVIVNMASAAGVLPLPGSPVYCAGARRTPCYCGARPAGLADRVRPHKPPSWSAPCCTSFPSTHPQPPPTPSQGRARPLHPFHGLAPRRARHHRRGARAQLGRC